MNNIKTLLLGRFLVEMIREVGCKSVQFFILLHLLIHILEVLLLVIRNLRSKYKKNTRTSRVSISQTDGIENVKCTSRWARNIQEN